MYNIFTQALVGTALLGSAFGAAVPALSKRAVWSPEVGSSYQIVITNILNIAAGLQPNVEVFDIDLFETPADTISQLHALGKKVICYFSAGTSEDWRPDWASFKEEDKGACLPQWPGERWLNVRSADVWSVMQSRIKLASDKGCDAIDPDNMDGYSNDNSGGLGLTTADAVTYIKQLSDEAAKYGMSTGLKNAQEILPEAKDYVQFAVNEECAMNSGDCASYSGFGKPVYHIEYTSGQSVSSSDLSKFCESPNIPEFTTVIKTLNLDGWVTYCDGQSVTTPTTDSPPQKGGKDCAGSASPDSPESLGLKL